MITTNYVVEVIGDTGTSMTLSALIYDFSGSSYHYNNDFPNIPVNIESPTPTPTLTNTPTNTATTTPSNTPTATNTPTNTATTTSSNTPTETATITSTSTLTLSPTASPTGTLTDTPTATSTNTPTNTATDTPTGIPIITPTNTLTITPGDPPTNTPTDPPTSTPTKMIIENTQISAPTSTPTGYFIPVTGFSPNVFTDLSHEKQETYASTSITLEIPSLGLNIDVVGVPLNDNGWNITWLGSNQAGWLEGSAFPSWNGNSVITGHIFMPSGRPGPFARLIDLKFGDEIIIHLFGQKYIFEVRTNAIVAPNDRTIMQHEEKPWLTLVTCIDYDQATGTYRSRFIVRAVLVKVYADN